MQSTRLVFGAPLLALAPAGALAKVPPAVAEIPAVVSRVLVGQNIVDAFGYIHFLTADEGEKDDKVNEQIVARA